jgi:diguanylate cyclase (GGDEF)-like protein
MRFAPLVGPARLPFFVLAAALVLVLATLALRLHDLPWLAAALLAALAAIACLHQLLALEQLRTRAVAKHADGIEVQLQDVLQREAARSTDLALLGRYGNLLLACVDLAEALQISEQLLSQMLPELAGTIYPLIDGEGLAEATHLWGVHVGETRSQASAADCHCMLPKRLYLASSHEPTALCPHVLAPTDGGELSAACIPLVAQGRSLGWLYLTAAGPGPLPKLQLAIAAADQLALALANLRLRENLRDLSVRDPLTGLFNRRYLSESLGRELGRSQRRNLPLSVLAFDLDHFKDFNDSYGHGAGDAILVAFARILQSHSRSEDIACRQGGEEFVLIMPEMELAIAQRRANEFLASMSSMKVMHEGQLLPALTTSIGLAVFPQHGLAPDALLVQADQALYLAKSRGRNQVAVAANI